MVIFLVADYGPGDLAFAEVTQRLLARLPDATVVAVPVPAFDTVSAGFCIAQLARNPGPDRRLVFHNVAPRFDADEPRADNEGERLVAARTGGGVPVVGPLAGSVLSFVRDDLASLEALDVPTAGSQFRSRDLFCDAVADLAGGDGPGGQPLDPASLAAPPERCVVWVDGYGNLKTSWHEAPAASGTRVPVRIGGVTAEAVVSDGTFEVGAGELSFAPGSSGWPGPGGAEVVFYELLLRGDSAAERFGFPAAGAPVAVGR